MPANAYLKVAHPWRATIDLRSPHAARFYLALIGQTLRFGAPATRRRGRVLAAFGRRGIPESALAGALRLVGRVRTSADDAADSYLVAAQRSWSDLVARDSTLPGTPRLHVLVLERASAITIFLFGDEPSPLVVAKLPRGAAAPVEREVAALIEAEPVAIAPRHLGAVDGLGEVQRGVRGRALAVEPLAPGRAQGMRWTGQHGSVADGLTRLAGATSKPTPPSAMSDDVVDLACSHPAMSEPTRRSVRAAEAELRHVPSVLRHMDTSPQNILLETTELRGLVDWESATTLGMPGGDMLNTAVSCIDAGVGLTRWSDDILRDVFREAWLDSSFGVEARAATSRCATAAGVPADLHDAIELLFFARRVGHRMARPASFTASAEVALAALEDVRSSRASDVAA